MENISKENIKDYCDFYLKCGVLLLPDVVLNFRTNSINSFELYPAHYLSTPGYSQDAVLRFTGADLRLISDMKDNQFIENMIRGGNSMPFKGNNA